MGEVHRVVSVSERRAWNRMALLAGIAARDLGVEQGVAAQLATRIADLAREQGLVLTAQVAGRPGR